MPLCYYKKLQVQDIQPTSLTFQFIDRSIKQPVGILEDFPIQVGQFFIPCDFIVMDMYENSQVSIILGRPFMATIRAVIDMQTGTMSFHLCVEKVDFCFPSPTPSLEPANIPSPLVLRHNTLPATSPTITFFDGDGGHPTPSDPRLLIPTSFGITSAILERQWIPLYNFTPLLVHLLFHRRLPCGGKSQAKDLKQVLLGRRPKHFIAFKTKKTKQKKYVLSLSSFPYCISFTSPRSFYLSVLFRAMKISSMGETFTSNRQDIMQFQHIVFAIFHLVEHVVQSIQVRFGILK